MMIELILEPKKLISFSFKHDKQRTYTKHIKKLETGFIYLFLLDSFNRTRFVYFFYIYMLILN